jgi:Trk-type K+ transport system membrane component
MIRYILHPKLLNFFLAILFFTLLGTVVFSVIEGWSLIDALYFTTSTMTTVGFGDLVPTHDASKVMATIYMLLSVPLILLSVGLVTEVVYERIHQKYRKRKRV